MKQKKPVNSKCISRRAIDKNCCEVSYFQFEKVNDR